MNQYSTNFFKGLFCQAASYRIEQISWKKRQKKAKKKASCILILSTSTNRAIENVANGILQLIHKSSFFVVVLIWRICTPLLFLHSLSLAHSYILRENRNACKICTYWNLTQLINIIINATVISPHV